MGTPMDPMTRLEHLLAQGQDNALLRFGLGQAYFKADHAQQAVEHLRQAVVHNPDYSAAWQLLGQALTALQQPEQALQAYESGIAAAQRRGDVQAGKVMQVFSKRLRKTQMAE